MRQVAYLPNLLSSLRIALAPAMLGAAYSNAKAGFTVLLAVALVTDAIDGTLARRWRTESDLGRRLDRWGDGLTVALGAIGAYFLWPEPVAAEWPWMLTALLGYALGGIGRVAGAARNARSHPLALVVFWAVPVGLGVKLAGGAPWGFRVAALAQLAVGIWRLVAGRARPENAEETGPAVR